MLTAKRPPQEKSAQAEGGPVLTGYEPVPSELARVLDRVEVDLFKFHSGERQPKLYRSATMRITEQQHAAIQSRTFDLFVRAGDFDRMSSELLNGLDEVMQDESLPQSERFSVLQVAAAAEIEHACTLLSSDKYVGAATQLGEGLVGMLSVGTVMPEEMFRVARHDYRTFAHVTNVSCFAVMLAKGLGISDEEELSQIAIGGMVHDIGKRHIPGEVLRKPGALTVEERALIQTHPQRGYEELVDRPDITRAQLMMVYQHHERVDGTGYPVRITGDEIHPWGKLAAVVDVFDAMTSSRTYRRPDPPQKVIEYQLENAGTHFDKEMVQCWSHMMAKI